MREKYDIRIMQKEIAADEQVSRTKPVLLTQREIGDLIKQRTPRRSGKESHDHI